jgi:hypothetical protein
MTAATSNSLFTRTLFPGHDPEFGGEGQPGRGISVLATLESQTSYFLSQQRVRLL